MEDILIDVIVTVSNIAQDRHSYRKIWFVDRVYKGHNGYPAYSNDSSYDNEREAHARKAEIIKTELYPSNIPASEYVISSGRLTQKIKPYIWDKIKGLDGDLVFRPRK